MSCDKDCEKRCTRRVKPYPNTPDDLPIQMVEPEEKPMSFTVAFLFGVAAVVVAGLFVFVGLTK